MEDDDGPEIDLYGIDPYGIGVSIKNGAIATSTANDTDFGSITLGSSTDNQFLIINDGFKILTINSISATNSAEFNANVSGYTFPLNIRPGGGLVFIVRFTPSALGNRTTTLNINSNDCDESPYNIALIGIGISNQTVTFDANGGLGSMATQTLESGTAANLTANAYTRTGYNFAGWNTAADGSGTAYANSASYTIGADDVPLYAQWAYIDFSVRCVYSVCNSTIIACPGPYTSIATVGITAINGLTEDINVSLTDAPDGMTISSFRDSNFVQSPYPDFKRIYVNLSQSVAPGSYTYTIVFTSVPSGIIHSITVTTTINAPVIVTCGPYAPLCVNSPAIPLKASADGLWRGPGVSGKTFNPAVAGVGTHTLFFSAFSNTKACELDCQTTITVNPLPTITCPANIIVNNTTGQCGANVTYPVATAFGTPTPVITYSPASGSFFPIGTTTVTARATNDCGAPTCTFTVTVNDTEAPVITCPSAITVANSPGKCGTVVNYSNPIVADNCENEAIILPTTFDGNTSSNGNMFDVVAVQTTKILSFDINPASPIAQNYEIYYKQGSFAGFDTNAAAWTLVGTATGVVKNGITPLPISVNVTIPAGETYSFYITCTSGANLFYTDGSSQGNVFASDSYLQIKEGLGLRYPFGTSFTPRKWNGKIHYEIPHQIPLNIVQTTGLPSGSEFAVGTTTNTFKVTDAAGNAASCSFNVIVNDTQVPVISCQGDIIDVIATSAAGAVVNYTTPVGTDNCAGAVTTRTAGLASGDTFPIGATTVTHLVTDAAGLTAECSFTVTVVGVAPAIACPENISVNNDANQCGAVVTFAATETVGIPASVITYSLASGSNFSVGTTTVTATATNAVGSSSCSFDVIVNDTQAPLVTCPTNITNAIATSASGAVVTYPTPVGTDNCTGAVTTRTAGLASGDTFPIGTTTVTHLVTDAAGLTVSCSFTVTVVGVAPAITCPANITVNNTIGQCGAAVTFAATETVGIPASIINYSLVSGSNFPVGTTTVTATATNAVGSSSCIFDVTVKDVTPPTIVCPSNIILTACQSTASWPTPTGNDNCSGVVVTQIAGSVSGATFAPGSTTTITYKATDLGGNEATCSFTVTKVPALDITVTNSNAQLYYGYSLDQSTTIKGVPSGGVAPYTVAITMNRNVACNVLNSSGDERWTPSAGTSTGTTCPSSGPGLIPLATASVAAAGNLAVTMSLLSNATITVTVTDANGCSVSKTTQVYAEDARCFAGTTTKVKICHRTGNPKDPCVTLCITEDAIAAHLAHGDYVGSCLPNCATPPVLRQITELSNLFDVKAYPNPFASKFSLDIQSSSDDFVQVKIYDMLGRLLEVHKATVSEISTKEIGNNYPSGVYNVVVSQGANVKTLRIIKR